MQLAQGYYTSRQRPILFKDITLGEKYVVCFSFIKCPDAVFCGRRLATFQTNILPPISFNSEAVAERSSETLLVTTLQATHRYNCEEICLQCENPKFP
jgi:hypothetical protein